MKNGISFKAIALLVVLMFIIGVAVNPAVAGKEEKIELVEMKEHKGAFMGIYPDDIDDEDREALDFKGKGVLIEDVVDDGPAEKAGLEAGDILLEIAGDKTAEMSDIYKSLKDREPGDKIKVLILRDGKEKSFKIKLGERPEMEMAMPAIPAMPHMPKMKFKKMKGGYLGVQGETLEGQLAEFFGVKEGVLIEEIVDDSPAQKAGLKAGDVIIRVGDEDIDSMEDLVEEVRDMKPKETVDVRVVRNKKEQTIKATLGETTWKDFHAGIGKRIIIHDDDDEYLYEFDWEDFGGSLEDIMENIDIEIHEGAEDLREEMEELREEMMKLKEELKKMKK